MKHIKSSTKKNVPIPSILPKMMRYGTWRLKKIKNNN